MATVQLCRFVHQQAGFSLDTPCAASVTLRTQINGATLLPKVGAVAFNRDDTLNVSGVNPACTNLLKDEAYFLSEWIKLSIGDSPLLKMTLAGDGFDPLTFADLLKHYVLGVLVSHLGS